MISYVSARVARKTGEDAKKIAKRWHTEIATVLAMRRARMAQRTLPRKDGRGHYITTGQLDVGQGARMSALWDTMEGIPAMTEEEEAESEC
eukprot:2334457-Karenia_brevis.AAC.1